jgi:hypothetical protein
MIAGMDDLIHTIAQVLMSTRYAPPRRHRAACKTITMENFSTHIALPR